MKLVYSIIVLVALCSSLQLISDKCEDKISTQICRMRVAILSRYNKLTYNKYNNYKPAGNCNDEYMDTNCAKTCGYCDYNSNFQLFNYLSNLFKEYDFSSIVDKRSIVI